ncbi:MAG: zinc ribbon domain-containing protein [Syntrophobacteraceae bacterium]
MPIYEYECLKCGKTAEAMQRFSDPPLSECPECKGSLRKLISMSTFHLKGSGWYTTDYCGKNQSTAQPNECKSQGCEKTGDCSSAPAPAPAKDPA